MFLLLLRMMITPDCIVLHRRLFFSSTFGWRLLCHKAMHNLSDAKTIKGTSNRFSVLTVISVIACGNIAGK